MNDRRARVRIESNPRRVRGMLSGRSVVDSIDSRFVWEVPYYPAWYFPLSDVRAELRENGTTLRSPSRGPGTGYDVVIEGHSVSDAAWRHVDSPVEELRDLVRFDFGSLDSWFEEDVQVFVHPRSPEVRIDALASSRHVVVVVDDTIVADSVRPTILYETGLPPRYYLPQTDVRMELLQPTDSVTGCPYKGWARYWDVVIGESINRDLAWGYATPLPESAPIAGLVSFYNERVDLLVDDVPLPRPSTKFS